MAAPQAPVATTGMIFDIKRFAVHDGPGIRTTVFFKGCPMACKWCHNPESISRGKQIALYAERCIACGNCRSVCPKLADREGLAPNIILEGLCDECGLCVATCYAGAVELAGRTVTVDEVVEEVVKDRPFYETSGGGATLSGGEPTAQFEFCVALLAALKDAGLHTALDTCGYLSSDRIETLLPLVDLFLYDLKVISRARHLRWTGADNRICLENLSRLSAAGATLQVRFPAVRGINSSGRELEQLARVVLSLEPAPEVALLPYHRLAASKYKRFRMPFSLEAKREFSQAELDRIRSTLGALGVKVVDA